MSSARTKLHLAVQNEDVQLVIKLLKGKKAKKDINVQDVDGQYPLHTACFNGNVDIVRELLRKSADTDVVDKNDWTPLHAAASGLALGHLRCCEILLAHGANPGKITADGSSALHYVVRMDVPDDAIVLNQKVIRSLTNPPESITDRSTREMLRKRIINMQNKHGESPLFHACSRGIERSAEFLAKDLGADVNMANNLDQTALHAAALRGNSAIVAMLLKHGADADKECDMGTPLEIAARYEHWAVATVLKSHFTPRMMNNMSRPLDGIGGSGGGGGGGGGVGSGGVSGGSGEDDDTSESGEASTGFGFIIGGGDDGDDSSDEFGSDDDDGGGVVPFTPRLLSGEASPLRLGGIGRSDSDIAGDDEGSDGEEMLSPRHPFRAWRYHCPSDGKIYVSLPMDLHVPAPKDWNNPNRIDKDSRLSLDLCKMTAVGGHTKYFIRGLLRINIRWNGRGGGGGAQTSGSSSSTRPGTFTWGVWVRVSPDQFRVVVNSWAKEHRNKARPYRGVLACSLPGYEPDTYNLKVRVRTQKVGLRPLVEVREDEDHPLVKQQRDGLTPSELSVLLPVVDDYAPQ